MATNSICYDFSELRGRIRAKNLTEREYARKISRSPQYVSKIFNGKGYFDENDIVTSIPVLDLSVDDVMLLFLSPKSSQMQTY